MSREYDIVVFGSTGYTGKFVNEELCRLQKEGRQDLKWAAAGRSKAKLEKSLRGKFPPQHFLAKWGMEMGNGEYNLLKLLPYSE